MGHEEKGYPKGFAGHKEVYGYGGIRIYQVSEGEAKEIVKEFPKSFTSTPAFAPLTEKEQLFYMNMNHGEQHFLFSLPIH